MLIERPIDENIVRATESAPGDWQFTLKQDFIPLRRYLSGGLAALASGEIDVLGGTVWLWASSAKDGEQKVPLDVLFVDEAGQMSLANVLAEFADGN